MLALLQRLGRSQDLRIIRLIAVESTPGGLTYVENTSYQYFVELLSPIPHEHDLVNIATVIDHFARCEPPYSNSVF